MDSRSVLRWLEIGEDKDYQTIQLQRKNFVATTPYKRRKIFPSQPLRRANSYPDILPSALTPSPSLPEHPPPKWPSSIDPLNMEESQRMPPPPSPSTMSRASRPGSQTANSQSTFSARSESPSRASYQKPQSSQYREKVLRFSNVNFRRFNTDLPPHLLEIWRQIREDGTDGQSEIDETKIEHFINKLFDEREKIESDFRSLLDGTGILPSEDQFETMTRSAGGTIFNAASLPTPGFQCCPISKPSPDYTFGYSSSAFTLLQGRPASSQCYSPASALGGLYLPFLVIEAKSQWTGGNATLSSNQCAGGGTWCVKAMQTLLERSRMLRANGDDRPVPIAYSLAIDNRVADLYLHWAEQSEEITTYFLQRIQSYSLDKPEDLALLQTHLSRIVDWGMGDRLETVRLALDQLVAIEVIEHRKRSHEQAEI